MTYPKECPVFDHKYDGLIVVTGTDTFTTPLGATLFTDAVVVSSGRTQGALLKWLTPLTPAARAMLAIVGTK